MKEVKVNIFNTTFCLFDCFHPFSDVFTAVIGHPAQCTPQDLHGRVSFRLICSFELFQHVVGVGDPCDIGEGHWFQRDRMEPVMYLLAVFQ